MSSSERLRFDGVIASASFATGDDIVVGCWPWSPFGPFVDAMWARPDGSRALLVDDGPQADFIWSHYAFDEQITCRTGATVTSAGLRFVGGPLAVSMRVVGVGALSIALGLRPRRLGLSDPWSRIEDRIARVLPTSTLGTGVRVRGVTRAGARERYVALDLRRVVARASVDGSDLGEASKRDRTTGFGFSEFPASPCLVRVTSLFDVPR